MNTLILNPPISIRYRIILNFKFLWLTILISVISLLIFYIFQVNSLTYENYLLKEEEKKLAEIKKEKENLEINSSQVHSLTNIENYFQEQNFKRTNQVKYIQILESSVVVK